MRALAKGNHTVLFSLLLTYLVVAIAPVVVIGYVSYTNHVAHIQERQSSADKAVLRQIRRSFEMLYDGARSISAGLISSRNTLGVNKISKRNIAEIGSILSVWALLDELRGYVRANGYVDSIYVYNRSGNMLFSSDGYSIAFGEFYDTDWVRAAAGVPPEGAIVDTRIDLNEAIRSGEEAAALYKNLGIVGKRVLSFISPLPRYMLAYEGFIVVNIDVDKVTADVCSEQASGEDVVYVVNGDGVVLLSNRREALHRVLPFDVTLPAGDDGADFRVETLADGEHVTYLSTAANGWTYMLRRAEHGAAAFSADIGKYILYVVVFLLVAGAALSVLFAKRFYNKVDGVVSTIKRMNKYHRGKVNEFELINEALESMYRESKGLQECLESNVQAIRDGVLRRFLSGQVDGSSLPSTRVPAADAALRLDRPYFAVGILVTRYGDNGAVDPKEVEALQKVLIRICETTEDAPLACQGLGIDAGRIVIVMNADDEGGIRRHAERIIGSVEGKLRIDAFVVLGGTYRRLQDIEKSYSEALLILTNNVFRGMEDVIVSAAVQGGEDRRTGYPFECQEKIIYYLKIADLPQVGKHFDLFIDRVYSGGVRDKSQVESDCLLLLSHIVRAVEISGGRFRDATGMDNPYRAFMQNDYDLGEIKAWFHKLFTDVAGVFSVPSDQRRYEGLIRRYIGEHYGEELSLEMIADRIGISYSYLRKIFKKMFGCGFPQYLNQTRIQKAMELLKSKDGKVAEILTMVGYNNEPSFFRNFRRIAGCTPEEYRRSSVMGSIP